MDKNAANDGKGRRVQPSVHVGAAWPKSTDDSINLPSAVLLALFSILFDGVERFGWQTMIDRMSKCQQALGMVHTLWFQRLCEPFRSSLRGDVMAKSQVMRLTWKCLMRSFGALRLSNTQKMFCGDVGIVEYWNGRMRLIIQ